MGFSWFLREGRISYPKGNLCCYGTPWHSVCFSWQNSELYMRTRRNTWSTTTGHFRPVESGRSTPDTASSHAGLSPAPSLNVSSSSTSAHSGWYLFHQALPSCYSFMSLLTSYWCWLCLTLLEFLLLFLDLFFVLSFFSEFHFAKPYLSRLQSLTQTCIIDVITLWLGLSGEHISPWIIFVFFWVFIWS